MFKAYDGTQIDILVDIPQNPKACLIVYPCIGGNTRIYMPPVKNFLSKNHIVIQYNPRTHGKSEGQMSMETALSDLYYFLSVKEFLKFPIFTVGHSAGCNALIKLNPNVLNIKKHFFVEPVFDFRESMFFMYEINTYNEFIDGFSKWISDVDRFRKILSKPRWLDLDYWHKNNIRNEINSISIGFKVGDFIENFFIPGFNHYDNLIIQNDKVHFFLSNKDNWFPLKKTHRISKQYNINTTVVDKANDHFFFLAWKNVWANIYEMI